MPNWPARRMRSASQIVPCLIDGGHRRDRIAPNPILGCRPNRSLVDDGWIWIADTSPGRRPSAVSFGLEKANQPMQFVDLLPL